MKVVLKMSFLWWLWVLATSLKVTVESFNINTKFPVIFQSSPGSYFGYSAQLHRDKNNIVALIGAPRANSSFGHLYEPGALFRCTLQNVHACTEINVDERETWQRYSQSDKFQRSERMWLGGSLDVRQSSEERNFVICGHLWKNPFMRVSPNGMCYIFGGDSDKYNITRLVPFGEETVNFPNQPMLYYAFGQVGTSASFSEDGKHLFLGAAGFNYWRGSALSYNLEDKEARKTFKYSVYDTNSNPTDYAEVYTGYAVTSGNFYDATEHSIAAGAPRDGDFRGRVYICKVLKQPRIMTVYQRKEGTQLGEYFGAAVLGVNVNGDKYSDLLVGAPQYSTENVGDEGKVYVFMSNGWGFQDYPALYGRKKINARFGAAIANIGDLNQDGFNDVAIGAPFEDGNGAIYIYSGSSKGINTFYSQRIEASQIGSSLSGFGIHISRGLDVDSNKYPDILVGAFSSSKVVLLKSQPVVHVSGKLSFYPKQINRDNTDCQYLGWKVPCINITACLRYQGKHVSKSLAFINRIYVDHPIQTNAISPRAFFLSDNRSLSEISQKSTLDIGKENCITRVLFVMPEIKDVFTPILIFYEYALEENKQKRKFNKGYPVIDPASFSNISSALTFQTGCGASICISDLEVNANVLGVSDSKPIVIGKSSQLTLHIEVVNWGEHAYLSELLIFLPPELPSISEGTCSLLTDEIIERETSRLLCELGNPLPKDKKVKLQIKLDLTKVPTDRKQIPIVMEARTVSKDKDLKDNTLVLPLNFTAVSDISIKGISSQEQLPYDAGNKSPLYITHTYFVTNLGPSPVQTISMSLFIPFNYVAKNDQIKFVSFTSIEAYNGRHLTIPAKCNDSHLEMKPIPPDVKTAQNDNSLDNIDPMSGNFSSFLDGGTNTNGSILSRRRRDIVKRSTKKDNVLDCATTDCIVIECSASPFSDTRNFARIAVSVVVDINNITKYLGTWNRMQFETKGKIWIAEGNSINVKNLQSDETMVKTLIVNSAPPEAEEVSQLVIFASIGVGILLLLIILVLLIKFGFFKRKQKEKMERMKASAEADNANQDDTHTVESEVLT